MNNTWKQPIPTNLELIFGEDYRLIALYKELIYRACNSDCHITLDGRKFVDLKRGQVLFGRNKFAKYLCSTSSTVNYTLQRLVKGCFLDIQLDMQPSKDYTIITILNYDELVGFKQANEQALDKQLTSIRQALDTSKSVESVKTEKTVEIESMSNDIPIPSLKEKIFSKRASIDESVIAELAQKYAIPVEFAADCWDSAQNWLDAKGNKQKDYRAFLANWIKRERANFLLKSKQGYQSRGGVVDVSNL